MTVCMGKSSLFCLPCLSFVNVYQFCVCVSFPFGFESGMWVHHHSANYIFWPFGITGFMLSHPENKVNRKAMTMN